MEVKTNKAIYPMKLESKIPFDWDKIKKQFPKNKEYGNYILIPDRDYSASLKYLEEENGILFFCLSKCDKKNITIADFEEMKDKKHYLKEKQKRKNHSLFAVIKDKNILLALYNHDSFRYICPTLYVYLNKKLNIDFEAKQLNRDYDDEDVKAICSSATHIIVEKSSKDYKEFAEKNSDKNSKQQMKKYRETNKQIVLLQGIGKLPLKDKLSKINLFKKKKYDKILINGKNIGEVDILDKFYISFKCEVKCDEDGLPIPESFIAEIQRIYGDQDNKTIFDGY